MMRTLVGIALACWVTLTLPHHGDNSRTAQREGTIRGSIHDKRGDVLPGVTIAASLDELRKTVVTDRLGAYEIGGLRAGAYTVTATLAGFVTGVRTGVAVRDGDVARVEFALCPAALEFIDWVAPAGLTALWEKADVVARVEIAATQPVTGDCPTRDVEHRAAIRELLKDSGRRIAGTTLTFIQENWSGERTPYARGREMVVFLGAGPTAFSRIAGPSSVFLVHGDTVANSHYLGSAGTMATAAFVSTLRALARTERQALPPGRATIVSGDQPRRAKSVASAVK